MLKLFDKPETLLNYLEKAQIKFVELWLTDIQGQLKSISVHRKHLTLTEDKKNLMPKGFDGSSIDGMSGISHSDLMAIPEWRILYLLPENMGAAALFCHITDCKKMPFYQGDWRSKLRTNLQKIKQDKEYEVKIGLDLEFYIFDKPAEFRTSAPLSFKLISSDAKGYFELGSANLHQELLTVLMRDAEKMGIRIARAHHEGAYGQFEIELAAEEPVQMADNVIILRHLVRNYARHFGKIASFMPKPFTEKEGSAMHLRMAIFKQNKAVLYEQESSSPELSIAGKSAIVGLTRHAYCLMIMTNQWVNSYKRLQPGFDAPCNLKCSTDIRATSLHINHHLDNHMSPSEWAINITHPDAACNPYLAFNALIASALAENSTDDFQLVAVDDQNQRLNLDPSTDVANNSKRMPQDLGQAITVFKDSLTEENSIALNTFGSELCESVIKIKSEQWNTFQQHVSDWEIQRYQQVF